MNNLFIFLPKHLNMKAPFKSLAQMRKGLLLAAILLLTPAMAQNLSVTITTTDNATTQVTGKGSLQAAIDTTPLANVQNLEVTAGTFQTIDWEWLQTNRSSLTALTHFTITDGVSSVADIPSTTSNNPYFGAQLEEISVAKATSIGVYAFGQSTSLTTVSFPQATSIGNHAFRESASLTTVSFPQVTSIGAWAFYDCSSLTTASFPQMTSIERSAFSGCSSLTTLTLGAAPPSVDWDVFGNAPTTRYLVLVDAGGNRLSLAALTTARDAYRIVDDGSTTDSKWQGWEFDQTLYLVTDASAENGRIALNFAAAPADSVIILTVIPDVGYVLKAGTFKAHKTGDESVAVEIVGGVITMPAYDVTVTAEFEALPSVVIASDIVNGTVTATPNTNVTIGTQVTLTAIPDAGYKLKTGTLKAHKTGDATTPVTITAGQFTMPAYDVTVTAEFEINSLQLTLNGNESRSGTTLQNALSGVDLSTIASLKITAGAFNGADWEWLKTNRSSLSALTHFTITDGVSSVADIPSTTKNNRYFGAQLEEISVAKVTSIGDEAFRGCASLTTVSFPQATSIGAFAFGESTSLTTVSFPQATSIGVYAFRQSTSLTTVSFPQATSIGEHAFRESASLTTVSFPQVTSIGAWAFYDCSSLTTASFPQMTSIGWWAFSGCSSLTTLTLGAAPPAVAWNVFENAPTTRYLVLVDTEGNELSLAALTTARDVYRIVDDGSTTDSKWYGWELDQMLYLVTDASAENGRIALNFAAAPADSVIILTVIPDVGYVLKAGTFKAHKTGDATTPVTITAGQFTMPAYDVTVAAEFEPIFDVEIASGISNGAVTATPDSDITVGTQVTLTATPALGYALKAGSLKAYKSDDESVVVEITDGVFTMPAYDVTVTAEFEPIFDVEIASGISNGAVTATPDSDVTVGTQVTLTAIPDAGYKLKTGTLKAHKTGDATTPVTITAGVITMPAYDVTVTAEFEAILFSVAIASGISNGAVTATPDSDVTVGTQVTLTATPALGYALKAGSLKAYKSDDESVVVEITDGVFTMPAYDVTVTAEFEPIFDVEIASGISNGSLSATPNSAVTVGMEVTLTATPDVGYQFKAGTLKAHKTGDATTPVTITAGQFTMPAYDVTVTAEFIKEVSAIELVVRGSLQVSAYFNPVTDYLILNVGESQLRDLSYQLYDIGGTLLQKEKITNTQTHIGMAHLTPAVYFVRVLHSNRDLKSFKIIKR